MKELDHRALFMGKTKFQSHPARASATPAANRPSAFLLPDVFSFLTQHPLSIPIRAVAIAGTVDKNGNRNSQAVSLAKEYMEKYYILLLVHLVPPQ